MPRQVHQIVPTLEIGDAISNQTLKVRALLRAAGYDSEIFTEHWNPKLANECLPYTKYEKFSQPGNILILHYAIGGEINHYALSYKEVDQVVLYYHNITPAHFFYNVNGEMARRLDEGRRSLLHLSGKVQAIAASPYNQQELEGAGIEVVGVAPYILVFDLLEEGLNSPGAKRIREQFENPDTVDWLYVGRLAPNKCLEDTITAFYYYHTWIEPNSRLLLVGRDTGMELYGEEIRNLVTELALTDSVVFAGPHGAANGLAAFYQMADIYISMSEHEGFCIPLIEAMHFDLPVVTHAATGVPFTMDQAGVLIQKKEPAVIAELAHEIVTNEPFRAQLISGQRKRLDELAPDKMSAKFQSCLSKLL